MDDKVVDSRATILLLMLKTVRASTTPKCKDANCSSCPLNSESCFICQGGYYLNQKACYKCLDNCRVCSQEDQCAQCSFFFRLKDDSQSQCVSDPFAFALIGMNFLFFFIISLICCCKYRSGKENKQRRRRVEEPENDPRTENLISQGQMLCN